MFGGAAFMGGGFQTVTRSEGFPNAPDRFVAANWSVSDSGTGGDITIAITTMPDDDGSPITDIEYQIDALGWVPLGAASIGSYLVSGLVDGVAVDVTIRAVNAIGAAQPSDIKTVTPTTA